MHQLNFFRNLFLLIGLCSSTILIAQQEHYTKTQLKSTKALTLNDDDFFIIDRFGNKFHESELRIPKSNPIIIPFGVNGTGTVPFTTTKKCNVGKFEILFIDDKPNYGFDSAKYRNLICSLFYDVDRLIGVRHKLNASQPISILVGSDSSINSANLIGINLPTNVDVVGTSFYPIKKNLKNALLDNFIHYSLMNGESPYYNLNGMNAPNSLYDYASGVLMVNFKNRQWYGELYDTTIASNQKDLYTHVLRQVLIMLGLNSEFNASANSKQGNNLYTRFDNHLYENSNKIITYNTTSKTVIKNLTPSIGCSGSNTIYFNGSCITNIPVYNDTPYRTDFNYNFFTCGGSGLCNSSYAKPGNNYIMVPCLGTGNTYLKRHPHPNEVKALADIGYKLRNIGGIYAYGADPNNNSTEGNVYKVYDSCLSPCLASGVHDTILVDSMRPVTINFASKILVNDYPSTAGIYRMDLLDTNKGTLTYNSSSFTFTPKPGWKYGRVTIAYFPQCNSTATLGNITYITLIYPYPPLKPCVPNDDCNYLCYGTFEESDDLFTWSNFNVFEPVPFDNTSDLFNSDNRTTCYKNFVSDFFHGCNESDSSCIIETDNLYPHVTGGNQFIGLFAGTGLSQPYSEGLHFKLKRPIFHDTTKVLRLKFLARLRYYGCQPYPISVVADDTIPDPIPMTIRPPIGAGPAFSCRKFCDSIGSALITTDTWHLYDIKLNQPALGDSFTSIVIFTPPLPQPIGEQPHKQIYAYFDNFVLYDSIEPKITIASNPDNITPCSDTSHTIDYYVCIKNLAGLNSDSIIIKVDLPYGFSIASGGDFNALGKYTIPITKIGNTVCDTIKLNYNINYNVIDYNVGKDIAIGYSSNGYCIEEVADVVRIFPQNKAVVLKKTVSKANPIVGDTVTFFFEICNQSNTNIYDLELVDTLHNKLIPLNYAGFNLNGSVLSKTITIDSANNGVATCLNYGFTCIVKSDCKMDNKAYIHTPTNICFKAADTVTLNAASADTPITAHIKPTSAIWCGNNIPLQAVITNPSGLYTYQWFKNGTAVGTNTANYLATSNGLYRVKISKNGCTSLVEAKAFDTTFVLKDSVLHTKCNSNIGSIHITVSSGLKPYTYTWGGKSVTDSFLTGLSDGNYIVTVTDSIGCIKVDTITILRRYDTISVTPIITNQLCIASKGSINLLVAGGTPPYKFLWNDANTEQTRSGLNAGTYYVTVTDSFGCYTIDTMQILLDIGYVIPLSVTKTVSKSHPKVGETVTFTITICNSSSSALDTFQIIDTLPNGITLINSNGFSVNGNVLNRSDVIGASPNCKTYTYSVVIDSKTEIENCVLVQSVKSPCIVGKDCIRFNNLIDVCLHKITQFKSPLNPYSIVPNTGFDVVSYSNDTFNLKFKTMGNHIVVVYNGSNYDTFPVNVIVPQPYIAVSQNLICNSDFPPNGDNNNIKLTEGKCQQVCENSCVWYYAGSYSIYRDRVFKWKVQGAKNYSPSANIIGDSILVCWGSESGSIQLVEESIDGCTDTSRACIQILKESGMTDFGVLPNIQDSIYYLCIDQEFNFKDTSTIRNAPNLESWCWDFGDGYFQCGDVNLDGLPPSVFDYTYSKYGTFQVKLSYTTKCGCVISKTKTIVVDSGIKLNIYCENPVCPYDTVEYFVDSFCAPPYDWSVTNGIIIGANNNARVLVQWGDPSDGIGILTLTAPPGCNVCNPIQTLKVNILTTNPDVVYPLSACAGESVTHTSIQMSSTKYGWIEMSSSAPKDSIYYQNFIVPSSSAAGSSFANYVHQMFLFDKYNQLKCSSAKLYTTRIKDTFRWVGPDTACIGISTSYAMNPAIKSADTIEITGGNLLAPVLFYGMNSFAYTFPQSGIYYIKAKDDLLCDKESCVKEVIVLPKPVKPSAIIGKTTVCLNEFETYRVSPKEAGFKYGWILPLGDSLINASGDYAQIKFMSSGVKKLGVVASFIGSPSCSSDTTWFTVACNTTTAHLIGDNTACANDSSIFSVSDTTGYNYSWRLIPSNGIGSIVKVSESKVKIAWNDISINTSLTVRAEFSVCGLDTFAEKTIDLLFSPAPDITGKDTVCIGSTLGYGSSLVSTSSPAYYNWTGTGLQIVGQSLSTDVTFPKTGTFTLNLFTRTGTCQALKKVSKIIRVLPLPETHISLIPACNSKGSNTHTLTGTIAIIGNGRYKIINPNSMLSSTFSKTVSGSGVKGNYTIFDSVTGCQINVPVIYPECTNNSGMSPDIDTGTNGCEDMKLMGDSVLIGLSTQCGYLNYNFIPVGNFTKFYMKLDYQYTNAKISDVLGRFEPGKYGIKFAASHGSTQCFVEIDTSFEIRLKADMDASVICEDNTRKIFLRDKSTFIVPHTISTRNWTIKKGIATVATGTGASYTSPPLYAGSYTAYLAVSNNSGETCYDTQTVTIDSLRVSFTVDKTQICHEGVVKFTSTSPDSGKIAVYTWKFAPNVTQENKNGITQYRSRALPYDPELEVTDIIGCPHLSAKTYIQVFTNNLNSPKPSITLSANNICANQVPINATVNALPPNRSPYQYKWSHRAGFTHDYEELSSSGSYHVKVVDKYDCEGTSIPVPVQIYLSPEIEVTGKERICLGDNIHLSYDAGTANLVFNPMTGVSSNQIHYAPTSAGSYPITAMATNSAGCADTLIKEIMVHPKPNLSIMQTTKSCRPYEVTLTAMGSNPRSPLSTAYLWTHGPNQSVINVRQGGNYYIKFTDTNGCRAIDSIKVEKALRFLNFPEGCFEVCQDVSNSKPVVFDLSFDRPAYDAWTWYRNDSVLATGTNSRPTNPWTINYPTPGSFKYQLSLTHKGCTIKSPPIYIVVLPQPCTFRKMAYNTNGTSPRIYPVKELSEIWSLYPSPANNKLYIQSNFSLKNKEIVIYSMTGIVLYRGSAEAQPINLSRFTSGVYLAQLIDGGKILGKQTFVVEKE